MLVMSGPVPAMSSRGTPIKGEPCTSGRQTASVVQQRHSILPKKLVVHNLHLGLQGSLRKLALAAVSSSRANVVVRSAVMEPAADVSVVSDVPEVLLPSGVYQGTWKWRGHNIRYQRCGDEGPPLILVHGFGGNADHWRKNLPVLGKQCRVYAVDLLGYGYSDKPCPRGSPVNTIYTFETWGDQILDFMDAFIGEPAFLICNSVGGLAGLQAAIVGGKERIRGVQLLNISLRMLHESKQSPLMRPLVKALQQTLRDTSLGEWFFSSVARPQTVKSILQQCYGDPAAVTEELVDVILKPGLQPGAAAVFLDFISYSGGPTPEELLQAAPCPVSILWGAEDPWEKLEWGQALTGPTVEEFVPLKGVGHCPQDEAPHLVNPLVIKFVERHSGPLPAPGTAAPVGR